MNHLNRIFLQGILCLAILLKGASGHAQSTPQADLNAFNAGFYTKFGNGKGINRVYKVLELSNGKILVGGTFLEVNGFAISGIARLNADGSFDHTFHSGMSSEHTVYALAELPSGKILVGGEFSSYDGASCGNFVVLNADGTRDMSYSGTGVGSSSSIYDIQVAADNKVIVAGYFTSFNGVSRNGLVRLTTTLQVDQSFVPVSTSGGDFSSVLIFPNGSILAGGDGNTVLMKLTASGGYDVTFNVYTPAGNNKRINKLKFTDDGKILMCGKFYSYGGHPTQCIARLNMDGTVDTTFENSSEMQTSSLVDCMDYNGYVVIAGGLDIQGSYNVKQMAYLDNHGNLQVSLSEQLKVNTDGTVNLLEKMSDGSFIAGGIFSAILERFSRSLCKFSGINALDKNFFTPPASHRHSALLGDGNSQVIRKYGTSQYLVSGDFTEFNGDTINGLVRLNMDGSVDPAFNAHFPNGVVVNAIEVQPDGKVLVNYQNSFQDYYPKLVRLNTDGSLDNTFSCSLQYPVYKILLGSGGKIIIAGDYQSWSGEAVYKLESDGTLDPAFTPYTPAGGNDVYSVIELSDGKILVASRWGGVTRILPNGSVDPSFSYNYFSFSTTITGFALQSDGKIVFSAPGGNRIYRLNANGTTDASYQSEYNVAANDQEPSAMELQPDNKLLVFGDHEVFRFNADGSLDSGFKQIEITGGKVSDFLLDSLNLLIAGNYMYVNGQPVNDLVGIDYTSNNTVGIAEWNKDESEFFDVFPNPLASGQQLSWKSEEQIESVSVHAMDGRFLQQVRIPSGKNEMDLNLAAGTYILRAYDETKKYKVARLVVGL